MQWSQASDVLCLEVRLQAQDIYQSHLGSLEASPMEWRALFLVLDIDVHTSLSKVVNAESLVLLSGKVHHTGPKLVPNIEVSATFLNQEREHGVVAVLSNVVQSSEVLVCLHVDPVSDFPLLLSGSAVLVRNYLPPNVLEDDLERVGVVEVSTECQETEVEGIFHDGEVQLLVRHLEVLDQSLVVLFIDQFEDPLGGQVRDMRAW